MLGTFSEVGIITNHVDGNTFIGIHVVLVTSIGGDEGSKRHDVLGEGSSLIGADDGDGSKSLNGGKSTDNGVLRSHDLDGVRVGEGDDGLKSFGNHGNSTGEGNVDGSESVLLVVVTVEEGDEEGGETHGTDGNEEVLGNHVDLLQHVGLDGFGVVDETVDGTNLGEISSRDGNTDSTSLSDKSSRVGHVLTISKRNLIGV
mmetsp:Transcript_18739/g.40626  ORF Transcript_18739/g.40626 Transcript_18739/m.40626 type:complete len:201 (+) Transcript_18739:2233-2835(+)